MVCILLYAPTPFCQVAEKHDQAFAKLHLICPQVILEYDCVFQNQGIYGTVLLLGADVAGT